MKIIKKDMESFDDYKKLGTYDKIYIMIRNNPKIGTLLVNGKEILKYFFKKAKKLNEKIKNSLSYIGKRIYDFLDVSKRRFMDFLYRSPLAILDLFVHYENLTLIEKARLLLLLINTINTFRVILYVKGQTCDEYFCPNYQGGYDTQLKITKRLFFQMIVTFLISIYLTAESVCKRTVEKNISESTYWEHIYIYMILAITWIQFSHIIWHEKDINKLNNFTFHVISFQEFKRILESYFVYRYNSRNYAKYEKNRRGDLNVEFLIKNNKKKTYIIRTRSLDQAEDDFNVKDENWIQLNYSNFKDILKLVKNSSVLPNFKGIFISKRRKKINFYTIDIVFVYRNTLMIISMAILTYIDFLIQEEKKKQNLQEKQTNQEPPNIYN